MCKGHMSQMTVGHSLHAVIINQSCTDLLNKNSNELNNFQI